MDERDIQKLASLMAVTAVSHRHSVDSFATATVKQAEDKPGAKPADGNPWSGYLQWGGTGALAGGIGAMLLSKVLARRKWSQAVRDGLLGAALGGTVGFGAKFLDSGMKLTPKDDPKGARPINGMRIGPAKLKNGDTGNAMYTPGQDGSSTVHTLTYKDSNGQDVTTRDRQVIDRMIDSIDRSQGHDATKEQTTYPLTRGGVEAGAGALLAGITQTAALHGGKALANRSSENNAALNQMMNVFDKARAGGPGKIDSSRLTAYGTHMAEELAMDPRKITPEQLKQMAPLLVKNLTPGGPSGAKLTVKDPAVQAILANTMATSPRSTEAITLTPQSTNFLKHPIRNIMAMAMPSKRVPPTGTMNGKTIPLHNFAGHSVYFGEKGFKNKIKGVADVTIQALKALPKPVVTAASPEGVSVKTWRRDNSQAAKEVKDKLPASSGGLGRSALNWLTTPDSKENKRYSRLTALSILPAAVGLAGAIHGYNASQAPVRMDQHLIDATQWGDKTP